MLILLTRQTLKLHVHHVQAQQPLGTKALDYRHPTLYSSSALQKNLPPLAFQWSVQTLLNADEFLLLGHPCKKSPALTVDFHVDTNAPANNLPLNLEKFALDNDAHTPLTKFFGAQFE